MSTVEQCERFFRGVIQWSLVLFLSTLSANSWATEPSGPPAFEEEEVKARLAEMPCLKLYCKARLSGGSKNKGASQS